MSAANISAGMASRTPLQVGEWSIHPDSNEAHRGGEIVRLEPKAMQVLVVLAQGAGRVVSREELFSTVWPGVVVGDEALTQSIIKLRRALGDNSRAPSYIETIAKRGYRLVAPVAPCAPAVPQRSPTSTAPSRLPRAARRAGWIAVLLLAVAVVGYWLDRTAWPADAPMEAIADDSRVTSLIFVAVTPFESLANGDEEADLARGMSEALVTDLSRLSALRVIRESVESAPSAGAQRARYRISGSVQRDAQVVRVNVHLLDTSSNEQLWSERFERPAGDLFAVQDAITARLVALLPATVSDLERQRLAKRYTRSLDAYESFLRGQALFLVRHGAQNEEARAHYRKAVELDPKFARAYAGLAMTHAMDERLGERSERSPSLQRALDLAQTARQIDPDLPEAYWALGFVHAQSRRHEQAIEALQHAIELDHSFADAYALLGGIHTYVGQPARSIPLLRTAMRLNPDAGYLYFLLLGRAYLFQNDVEQASINLRAASMRNAADVETRVYLAAAAVAAGDSRLARWEADEIRSLEPAFSATQWLETYPMTSGSQRARLLALLQGAGL